MKHEQGVADRHGWISDGDEASMAVPAFLLVQNVEACKTNDTVKKQIHMIGMRQTDA